MNNMEDQKRDKENANLAPPERFLRSKKLSRPLGTVNAADQLNRPTRSEKLYEEKTVTAASQSTQPGPSRPSTVSNFLLHPQILALKKNDSNHFITPVENNRQPPTPANVKLQHGNTNVVAKFFNMSRAEFSYNTDNNEEYFKTLLRKDIQLFFKYDSDIFLTNTQWDIIYKYIMDIHTYLHYSSSNLYQTMKIFHSFLQLEKIDLEDLQTVSLASMWIALKTNGSYPRIPQSGNMIVFIKDDNKPKKLRDLLRCERMILKTLDFRCSFVDVTTVVSYFLINLNHVTNNKTIYYISCYMIDIAMFRKNCCRISTVELAAAAVVVGCLIQHEHLDLFETTREIASFYQANVAETFLRESYSLQHKMVLQAKASLKSDGRLHAVFEKYQSERFGKVSATIKKYIFLTDVKLALAMRSVVM